MALSSTRTRKRKPRGKVTPPGSEAFAEAIALYGNNMLVPWYLMASYAYYVLDESLLTDEEYDKLCKDLYDKWDTIQHQDKDRVEREALRAGTGYQMTAGDYSSRVKGAADHLIWANKKGAS